MTEPSGSASEALRAAAERIAGCGASLTLEGPGGECLRLGPRPDAARVIFRSAAAFAPLESGDHLALAETYLDGGIDIVGEMAEVMKATDAFDLEPGRLEKLRFLVSFALDRRRFNRQTVAFHYDRPAEFFLPWLGRSRCYSHGFYDTEGDTLDDAQARKLQHAVDAMELEPGMRVFEMGAGWGAFLEHAGRRGIRVEGITISDEQHRYCQSLIRDSGLDCSIERVDFGDYRPEGLFDAAVFMGTFEHFADYRRAARLLARHLKPGGRVYADFCAQRESFLLGRFMRKHIWPGSITYVDLAALVAALVREGFNVHELGDDTLSYAFTVRDWARGIERAREAMAAKWGEPQVRAFLLFLWGSYHFLKTNRTQAYHLVAGRGAAGS